MYASKKAHISSAGTTTYTVRRLLRVVVGTGASSATVTLQEGSGPTSFAVINAAAGGSYDFNCAIDGDSLTVVVAQAPDVTIFYD